MSSEMSSSACSIGPVTQAVPPSAGSIPQGPRLVEPRAKSSRTGTTPARIRRSRPLPCPTTPATTRAVSRHCHPPRLETRRPTLTGPAPCRTADLERQGRSFPCRANLRFLRPSRRGDRRTNARLYAQVASHAYSELTNTGHFQEFLVGPPDFEPLCKSRAFVASCTHPCTHGPITLQRERARSCDRSRGSR
jgi:hypothetical protein